MARLRPLLLLALLWVGSASAGLLDKLPWVIAEKQAASQTAAIAAAAAVPTANTPFRVMVNYENVAPFILGNDVSGDVLATAGGTLKSPIGDKAVQVVGHMPKASVAAALGRAVSKGVPVFGTGYAIYDLVKELGMDADHTAGGVPQVYEWETVENECPTCVQYAISGVNPLRWSASPESAFATAWSAIDPSGRYGYTGLTCSATSCGYYLIIPNEGTSGRMDFQSVLSRTGGTSITQEKKNLTPQQVADKIAAKSGWPTTSKLAAATAAAIAAGEVVDVIPKEITGPADSGPAVETSRTTDSATGTTTVTKEKQQYKYNPSPWPYSQTSGSPSPSPGTLTPTGTQPAPQTEVAPSVSITNITTTTVTNTQTGDVINNTETVKVPVPPPETVVNPAAPPPEDPCLKNPDRAGCVNLGTPPPAEKLPEKKTPVVVTPIPFAGGGGSCPAPLTLNVFGAAHEISYQPICDQLSILRALMLSIAGLMAAYILADSFKVT